MWDYHSLKHNIKGVSGRKQTYTYIKLHNRKEKPSSDWSNMCACWNLIGRYFRAVPYRIAPWPHHPVTSSDWSNMCACWNTQIWLVDTSVPYRIASRRGPSNPVTSSPLTSVPQPGDRISPWTHHPLHPVTSSLRRTYRSVSCLGNSRELWGCVNCTF